MSRERWPRRRLLAEFPTSDALLEAVARVRAAGLAPIEVNSPFPVPGAEDALGLRRSRLPALVFVAGLVGGASGLWIQWFTNAWDYPLNVGGRPLLSWPAWIPVTFELTILGAALGGVLGFAFATGLPRLWDPVFEAPGFESATTDRFWLVVGLADPDSQLHPAARAQLESRAQIESARAHLEAAGAARIVVLEDGDSAPRDDHGLLHVPPPEEAR